MNEPWLLTWGTHVWATVQAHNAYGSSLTSEAGNGALLVTVPDAPVNLQNDVMYTNANQIGLKWEDGPYNGGNPINDYRLTYEQGDGVYSIL